MGSGAIWVVTPHRVDAQCQEEELAGSPRPPGLACPIPRGANPLQLSAADLTRDTVKLSLELLHPVCQTGPTAPSPTLPDGTCGILVHCVQVQSHGGWLAGWHWAQGTTLTTSDSELRPGTSPTMPSSRQVLTPAQTSLFHSYF